MEVLSPMVMALDVGSLLFNEDFAFIGFKEEEYFVLGQCNGDSVLDLQKIITFVSVKSPIAVKCEVVGD